MKTEVRSEKALEVAKWFLQNNNSLNANSKDSNLKLQKLLYYAQCMHLAVFKQPLYEESIEAWENGPVVRDVYEQYRYYNLGHKAKSEKIQNEPVNVGAFQEDVLRVINIVYGQKSACELINLTHDEKPWSELREQVNRRENPVITHESILESYECLEDIFNAYRDYDVDETSFRLGSTTITHRSDLELTKEDRKIICEAVYDIANSSVYVSRDSDGGLVIY